MRKARLNDDIGLLCLHELAVCGLVFNRISVRFLMALVQWCSGYVSFLAAPLAAGYFQVLNREQSWFETPAV